MERINDFVTSETNLLETLPEEVIRIVTSYLNVDTQFKLSECGERLHRIIRHKKCSHSDWCTVQHERAIPKIVSINFEDKPQVNRGMLLLWYQQRNSKKPVTREEIEKLRTSLPSLQQQIEPKQNKRFQEYHACFTCANSVISSTMHINWKLLSKSIREFCAAGVDPREDIFTLLDAMPHFDNLTHLKIASVSDSLFESTNRFSTGQRVKMSKLQHLEISCELLTMLNKFFVNFDHTRSLQSISLTMEAKPTSSAKVVGQTEIFLKKLQMREHSELDEIQLLIQQQTKLRELHLQGNAIVRLFTRPLKIQSLLEKFEINTANLGCNALKTLSIVQQTNICSFIAAQTKLSSLKIDCFVTEKIEPNMIFMREKLNRPLKSQTIRIWRDRNRERMNTAIGPQKPPRIFFDGFTSMEEFSEMYNDNLTNDVTKELKIFVDFRVSQFDVILPILGQKFVNVNHVEITDLGGNFQNETVLVNCMAALNDLKKLKKLTFNSYHANLLNDITIPTLESFKFNVHEHHHTRAGHIETFIDRHRELTELVMDATLQESFGRPNVSIDVFRFALEKLTKLQHFSIKVACSADKMLKDGRFLRAYFVATVRLLAKPGFVLQNLGDGSKFKKRHDDGEMMSMMHGSKCWKILI